jgi:hypothetical protein
MAYDRGPPVSQGTWTIEHMALEIHGFSVNDLHMVDFLHLRQFNMIPGRWSQDPMAAIRGTCTIPGNSQTSSKGVYK